jgi:hypothetical protein
LQQINKYKGRVINSPKARFFEKHHKGALGKYVYSKFSCNIINLRINITDGPPPPTTASETKKPS